MAELTGNEILARCLKAQGVKDIFYIMGGPMLDVETECIKEGIRLIDTRHEQGAAYMAQAYSRVTQGPGVCIGASGPGALNLGTGLANALIDCCPVIALGGFEPDQPVRPPGLPGDRPGQGVRRLGQIRRPRAQSEAPAAADELRVPEGAERQARPGLSRFPRRRALHDGRRGRCRLELLRPADHQGAPLCRAQGVERARRCDQRSARSRSSSRAAACCGRRPGTRCGPLSKRPGSRSTRPRKGAASCPDDHPYSLPDDAQRRVPRGRSDHHSRHAHELRDRPRLAAAVQRPTPKSRASTSTPRRWATRRAISTSRSSATASRYCSS